MLRVVLAAALVLVGLARLADLSASALDRAPAAGRSDGERAAGLFGTGGAAPDAPVVESRAFSALAGQLSFGPRVRPSGGKTRASDAWWGPVAPAAGPAAPVDALRLTGRMQLRGRSGAPLFLLHRNLRI